MRVFFAFAFLFLGLNALTADHHGKVKDLPGCCAEGCCCTGADECTGCACTEAGEAEYPMTTCVVSGEDLGSMGEPIVYWHKIDGQPDREVRFCCEMCQGQFDSNPDKFLAKLDAAVAEGTSCCASADCCTGGSCSACADGDCDKSCCKDGECADCA